VPFKFTGKINRITLTINRPKHAPADEKRLMDAQRAKKASE
jgi:arylsulfatase